jgi:hypothetical protein
MMRSLNFALILVTGVVCVATYRVAEDARVVRAELAAAERQIARERQALVVLGAEWASLTRPQRIHALVERHLPLTDAPTVELASFSMLPHRGTPPLPSGPLRDASAVVPALPPLPQPEADVEAELPPVIQLTRVSYRTGA